MGEGIDKVMEIGKTEDDRLVNKFIENSFRALPWDKINIAALGNIVSQLHVHHVARFKNDAAWPEPIWGRGDAKPYNPSDLESLMEKVKTHLSRYLA